MAKEKIKDPCIKFQFTALHVLRSAGHRKGRDVEKIHRSAAEGTGQHLHEELVWSLEPFTLEKKQLKGIAREPPEQE